MYKKVQFKLETLNICNVMIFNSKSYAHKNKTIYFGILTP